MGLKTHDPNIEKRGLVQLSQPGGLEGGILSTFLYKKKGSEKTGHLLQVPEPERCSPSCDVLPYP